MSNETIEIMVEEIMRTRADGDYDTYNGEELREHYRRILRGEEN